MLRNGRCFRISGNDMEMEIPKTKFFFPPPNFSFIPDDTPVPSFLEATMAIMGVHGSAIQTAIQHANELKQENKSSLDLDEIAAICLYTLEDNGIYFPLNQALRDAANEVTACHQILKPWVKYLRLLSATLDKLPNISEQQLHATVYRGVKMDLEASYKSVEGQVICWPGFTSCTASMDALSDPSFVGTSGKRTVFSIQCTRGKDIKALSPYGEDEAEVLIMATTKFRVTKVDNMSPVTGDQDLTMVTMLEVDTNDGYPLLHIPCGNIFDAEALVPLAVTALCEEHKEKIKFLCHDCEDKLVCNDCVMTVPCSEHRNRITLNAAIGAFQNEVVTNMSKTSYDWKQDLNAMNNRLQQVEKDGENYLTGMEKMFQAYHGNLDAMGKCHLRVAKDIVVKKSELLKERCTQIAKMVEDTNATKQMVTVMIANSQDSSKNIVYRYGAAKDAKDTSEKYVAASSAFMQQLLEWTKDEIHDKMDFVNSFNDVSKLLESCSQSLDVAIHSCPVDVPTGNENNTVSVDLELLNAVSQGNIYPVKMIDMKKPYGLCRVSSDEIAVAEADGGRISILSLSTKSIIRTFGEGVIIKPIAICIDNKGDFLVTDEKMKQIVVFDKDGNLIASSDPSTVKLHDPCGICFDQKNDRVVVAENDTYRVLILNRDLDCVIETIGGIYGKLPGQFSNTAGVGIDSRGRVIVSEWNNRIQVFEERYDLSSARGKSYQLAFTFGKIGSGNGELNYPVFLTIDSEDRIIVCERHNSRVQVFDSQGNFVACTPSVDPWCYGVCLDGKGRILCSSSGGKTDTIYAFWQ